MGIFDRSRAESATDVEKYESRIGTADVKL